MPAKAHKSKSIAQSFIGERIPYCHEVVDSLEISDVHQVPSEQLQTIIEPRWKPNIPINNLFIGLMKEMRNRTRAPFKDFMVKYFLAFSSATKSLLR